MNDDDFLDDDVRLAARIVDAILELEDVFIQLDDAGWSQNLMSNGIESITAVAVRLTSQSVVTELTARARGAAVA